MPIETEGVWSELILAELGIFDLSILLVRVMSLII